MAMIIESPAGARYSGSFTASVRAALQAAVRMLRFRVTLNALDRLDDNRLRDIGLTRQDLFDLRSASSADALDALSRIRF